MPYGIKQVPAERLKARLRRAENGCLEWQGPVNYKGYGQLRVDDNTVGAHRFAWMLAKGDIPKGLNVCHRCDNRRCCDVAHLFLGTNAENNADMVAKGRQVVGAGIHTTKLSQDQVREIRRRLSLGESTRSVAKAYGIVHSNVRAIQSRKTWKYL